MSISMVVDYDKLYLVSLNGRRNLLMAIFVHRNLSPLYSSIEFIFYDLSPPLSVFPFSYQTGIRLEINALFC